MTHSEPQLVALSSADGHIEDPFSKAPILGYLRAIKAHWLVCALIVLAALAGSAAWLVQRSPSYVAEAGLLVSPVPETHTSLANLPLFRAAGGDPERPVKTAATLIDSAQVARRASGLLDGDPSPGAVDTAIDVTPEEGENVISVEATAATPQLAARVANAYVDAALAIRRKELRPLVADAIERSRAELASLPVPDSERAIELKARIGDLTTIRDGNDPTLSIVQRASPPSTAEGPPASLILALALLAGIAIAAATAIMIELLVPGPINDEHELQGAFPLPVIARLPRLAGRRRGSELEGMTPGAREGFRTLRGQLEFRVQTGTAGPGPDGRVRLGGVIAIASPSIEDGKTTVALGLARAVAATRSSALLLEANVRDPALATRLAIEPEHDLMTLLDPAVEMGSIVTRVTQVPGLGAIVAPRVDNLRTVEQLSADASRILDQARRYADCVIVDTPPLSLAGDALPVLSAADQIVLVVRMRHTRRADLIAARELLAQRDLVPAGVVVVESPLVAAGDQGQRPRPEPTARARRLMRQS